MANFAQQLTYRLLPMVLCIVFAPCFAATEVPVDFDFISLQRTTCYGTCPAYSVVIRSDGHVIFKGQKFVSAIGMRTSQIPISDLQLLSIALKRISFDGLASSYATSEDGCKEVWTDNPSLTIELRHKNSKKIVNYYLGCRGLPILGRLAWLADTIDEVAQTSQWIGEDRKW